MAHVRLQPPPGVRDAASQQNLYQTVMAAEVRCHEMIRKLLDVMRLQSTHALLGAKTA